MGFSSGSWPLFRNADGTPRTARQADGLPKMEGVICADGSVQSDYYIDANTLAVSTQRGVTVHELVTPRVAATARDLFGCETLVGSREYHVGSRE